MNGFRYTRLFSCTKEYSLRSEAVLNDEIPSCTPTTTQYPTHELLPANRQRIQDLHLHLKPLTCLINKHLNDVVQINFLRIIC